MVSYADLWTIVLSDHISTAAWFQHW